MAPNPGCYICLLAPTPILRQLPPYRPVREVARVDVDVIVLGVLENLHGLLALQGRATAGEPARVGRREPDDHRTGDARGALVDVSGRGGQCDVLRSDLPADFLLPGVNGYGRRAAAVGVAHADHAGDGIALLFPGYHRR